MLDPYSWPYVPDDPTELIRCAECWGDFPEDELYRYPFTTDHLCRPCLCDEAEKEGLTPEDYIKVYEIIILWKNRDVPS